MRTITRYILREHVGPLLFALTGLTALLLLQYVARQLDKLVGKGLPWSVIGEFLMLSLPFTLAMTLPMAVLMATLHAFGRLAAENEITAFKASGVRMRTLMTPVLISSALLSLLMVGFNDRVLPQANHRLAILLTDIVNTRPTAALKEQVLTQLTPTFYMKVGWLDETSNRMRDVEIYDLQNTQERKSVYADSGTFTMSPDSVDLQLVLYNGQQLQYPEGKASQLQRTFFREQVVKVQDIAKGFSGSDTEGAYKSEREQSICELQQEYKLRADEYELRRQRWIAQLRSAAADEDTLLVVPRPRPAHGGLAKLYCETIPGWFTPKVAEAAEVGAYGGRQDSMQQDAMRRDSLGQDPVRQDSIRQDSIRQDSIRQDSIRQDSIRQDSIRRDSVSRAASPSMAIPAPPTSGSMPLPAVGPDGLPLPTTGPDGLPLPTVGPDGLPLPTSGPDGLPVPTVGPDGLPVEATAGNQPDISTADSIAVAQARRLAEMESNLPPPAIFSVTPETLSDALMQMNKYSVEVQKKFALSLACFVFVLFGPPIALRFPRGGVGVTIGVSLIVFGAYYVCLMAGETLADRGELDPVVAMWGANVIFLVAGLILLARVEKTTDSSRGGGLRDWWENRRARRQQPARERLPDRSVPA